MVSISRKDWVDGNYTYVFTNRQGSEYRITYKDVKNLIEDSEVLNLPSEEEVKDMLEYGYYLKEIVPNGS